MIRPTTFVYSSHNRGDRIHRDLIIQRALEGPGKNILYLPLSEGIGPQGDEYESQEYGYSKFRWYFDLYRNTGLTSDVFYWTSHLSRSDADQLLGMIQDYEVVILGGGSSTLGMRRMLEIGERFYGDRHTLGNMLHERQNNGKLTVGFSAGADQLCELLADSAWRGEEIKGFGLGARLACTLHHEPGREQTLLEGARHNPGCMWFGLPNDSGLAVQQGELPSGSFFQIIEFVEDNTWDVPSEVFHIKTRYGAHIEHYYSDGRNWSFHDGDRMLRIMQGDYQGVWIEAGGRIWDYWTQSPTHYGSLGDVLGSH